MPLVEIESKVKSILASKLDVNLAKVDLNSRLIDDLGMDSLGAIEMVFELEGAFGIKIPDKDFEKAVMVKDIVDYIATRISNISTDKK